MPIFLSRNSIESPNCRDEFNMARDTDKEVLVVYIESLESSDLKYGLRLRILSHQALMRANHESDESFLEELFKSKLLQTCFKKEGEEEEPKPKKAAPKRKKNIGSSTRIYDFDEDRAEREERELFDSLEGAYLSSLDKIRSAQLTDMERAALKKKIKKAKNEDRAYEMEIALALDLFRRSEHTAEREFNRTMVTELRSRRRSK